jgi:type IV secretory pathway TraG/TraD family ATPase VirD4
MKKALKDIFYILLLVLFVFATPALLFAFIAYMLISLKMFRKYSNNGTIVAVAVFYCLGWVYFGQIGSVYIGLMSRLYEGLLLFDFNYMFFSYIKMQFSYVMVFGHFGFGGLLAAIYFLINKGKSEHKDAGIISAEANISDLNVTGYEVDKKKMKDKLKEVSKNNHLKTSTLIGVDKNYKELFVSDDIKHMFIAGTTGSGKTVLLKNFIEKAVKGNNGLMFLDGKGDVGEGSVLNYTEALCKAYKRKLYVVNINNADGGDKYNPFLGASYTQAKDMLMNMTEWTEAHYKLNVERFLQASIKLMNIDEIKLSMASILKNMNKDVFIKLNLKLYKAEKTSKDEYINNINICDNSSKIVREAEARFATITESDVGSIFADDGVDIKTAMKEKAIILFVLNPLTYPELSTSIGKLVLIDAKKATSGLFEDSDNRKFFIFDELSVYSDINIIDLVNKSRSAGITNILATQSIADLDATIGESFKQVVIENCNNYVFLRQNSVSSAEYCANTIGTFEKFELTHAVDVEKDRLTQLEDTGKSSARVIREYSFHPDYIKGLRTGEGYYLSKDSEISTKVFIRMPENIKE